MYQSRLQEQRELHGDYSSTQAYVDYRRSLIDGIKSDNMISMNYRDKRRVHNLKYYTWIEQQEADLDELNRQWEDPHYWDNLHNMIPQIDELIKGFNDEVGLI